MDITTKTHLNTLIQLAVSDHEFSKEERKLIYTIAKQYGYDTHALERLMRAPESLDTFMALSETKRFEFLYTCMQLVLSDLKICERELTCFRGITHKLGFKIAVVDFINKNFHTMSQDELKTKVFEGFQ